MNQNLFNILETFSKQDWSNLGKFIASPYFVRKRNYKKIYTELKKVYKKENNASKLTEDYLKKKIFNGKNAGSQTLHNRLSEFCKVTEKFLSQENFERDTSEKQHYFLRELSKRQLHRNFNNSVNRLQNIFPENHHDADSLLTASKVLQLRSIYFQAKGLHEKSYVEFHTHSEYLTAYFLDKLFYIALEFLLLEAIDVKFDHNTAKTIVNSIDTEKFIQEIESLGHPRFVMVIIRYNLYKAFLNPDEKHYIKKVKTVFAKHRGDLNNDFKSALYLKLEAFYVNLINKGRTEYENELFLLYKEKLGQGIIGDLFKIYYPAQNFRDYVVVGLRVGEIDWVENFIRKYSPMLPESIRKDEQTIAGARVLISKKEFTKALGILQAHKSDKQIHIIDLSRLKLKIFYELTMYEEIFLEMDNLRHFVRKTNTHKFFSDMTKSFLNNLGELMKITTSVEKKERKNRHIDEFTTYLQKSEKLPAERTWLIEKANKMKA